MWLVIVCINNFINNFRKRPCSRGDARRTLRWLWNFLPDEVWDADTTRNPATAARQPRALSAGVSLEEYDGDLLGTNRPTRMPPGLTQRAPGERRPPARDPDRIGSPGRAAGNY